MFFDPDPVATGAYRQNFPGSAAKDFIPCSFSMFIAIMKQSPKSSRSMVVGEMVGVDIY
ncbi:MULTISPECIES: hypothetical protein [Halopseudomonas]|uniref:hypothetical protein n=1 Tax=Halopseudomonas TaxID=2901189 RepID=UPI000A7DEA3C|nr:MULTISPECIES: hypothetical protein [Halopseudomonas]WGK62056.1 hypothetical protein QAO71_02075 [Halopseudomonas sp. SMJS2]